MDDVVEGKSFNFAQEEERILQFWESIDAFKEQLRRTEGKKEYVFYDGPPFATGLPHYGHILAGTIKDVVTRYASQTGHHVERRFGWDCHGLPVEYEIDKKLGIKSPDDVHAMGIDKYNEECRSIVMRYSKEWEATVKRLGRWIDFENDYKTLNMPFMESVWWVFGELWKKGLVYKGFKVMPFSTACSTTLSNFEAGLNYKDVSDPAVMVSFPIEADSDAAELVAWTTTPWTLPSNLALCVHPDFEYVKARDPASGRVYVVAKARLSSIPGAVPEKPKGKGKGGPGKPGYDIICTMKGSDLVGKSYKPLFPYFTAAYGATAFRVVSDKYVTDDSGTGVVHQAPAFGEDDHRVCLEHGITVKGAGVPCPVDAAGRFTAEVQDFEGVHVKEADKGLVQNIKAQGRLVNSGTIVHSYPFCWRSDTPLIYKAVPSWFVRVEVLREQLLQNNLETYWVPAYVKEKRFHNWLENARDWVISRSRFWGTPIPIWVSDDGEEHVVVKSVEELQELTGAKVTDLHRHFIDHLEIPSRQGKGTLKRIPDVFDCWFESGSMPYAQQHYPFERKDYFEANFPADFIAEGLDQTRGWFYTLMVLSTALFGKPPFRNLVCNGLVLAADGKKMSKRLKNYPDPREVVDKYGADALRLYLINSPVVRAEPLRFEEKGVFDVVKNVFLPWYNAFRFLSQNIARLEAESGSPFRPQDVLATQEPSNVLDCWIQAATRTLVNTVRDQMDAYRLFNVVPFLLQFIEDLTNIYVRYNRKRLKGRNGPEDSAMALATLFDSLLKVCKSMAPLTPFLTEVMYQKLRGCLGSDAPESVHFCDVPEHVAQRPGDERIQQSVHRMQTVIELGRVVRERHSRPLRDPLRRLTVAHCDAGFVADLTGDLQEYVMEELNVTELVTVPINELSTQSVLPNFKVLGVRLGKAVGPVSAAIKKLGPSEIAKLQLEGSLEVQGAEIGVDDVIVKREIKPVSGNADANTNGDVVVVLDLTADTSLLAKRTAREVVNRFQRLRKKIGLQPSDVVELFVDVAEGPEKKPLLDLLVSEDGYLAENLGDSVLPSTQRPKGAVVLGVEETSVVLPSDEKVDFKAVVAAPAVSVCGEALRSDYGAKNGFDPEAAVATLVASKSVERLKEELNGGSWAVNLDGHVLQLSVGRHLFWRASDVGKPASS